MQVAFFCCFRQGVAGMSRDLGWDVPDLEKLYASENFGLIPSNPRVFKEFSQGDVLTDMNALPERVPGVDGEVLIAHSGMLESARTQQAASLTA